MVHGRVGPSPPTFCAQVAENRFAVRTFGHAIAGCGGRQRKLPTGGAAYGMPRNCVTVASEPGMPRIVPLSIFTGWFIAANRLPPHSSGSRHNARQSENE